MPVDIGGYSLSNSSGSIKFNTSNTVVDSSGRRIIPLLPAVHGSYTALASSGTTAAWTLDSTLVNTNGVWSTNTFTCPVAGVYYTSWAGICQGTGSATNTTTYTGYGGVLKNGTLIEFWHWNTNDGWDTVHFQYFLNCAAGDTIKWAVNLAPASVGSSPGAYRNNHNMCSIWLLG